MTDAALQPEAQTTRITFRACLIVFCSTLGTATYAFTWNSVGVALPYMQGAFSATVDQISWVMIAFIIGSSMVTASIGWFAARFGRRRIFLLAVSGFTITLVGCGSATSLEEEVLWRFLQGACGAALIPVGQTIAVSAFPPERHGQATSLWALGFVTANVVSPTIAGILIEHYGWSWIFYANLPIGIAVLTAAWILLPESPKSDRPLDWTGLSALILGVGALQLMLARGERLDWFSSTEIVVEAMVAASALWIFLIHTLTAKNPFIVRDLFKNYNFVLGQIFIFLVGAMLFLPLLLLPLMLQQISDYPAIEVGTVMMPRGIGTIIGLVLIAQIRDKIDPRPLLVFGLGLTAYAAWQMSGWTSEVQAGDVAWAIFLQGCATGAVWAPLNTLALSKLDKRVQDQGFAFFYLSFDIGSAVGTAAIVGLHTRHTQINHAVLTESVTPFRELAQSEYWSVFQLEGLAALDQEVTRQATMVAYNNSFLAIALTVASLIPAILLFRYKGRGFGRAA